MDKTGMAFHVTGELVGWCFGYEGWLEFFKKYSPLRAKVFKLIPGDRLSVPEGLRKAIDEFTEVARYKEGWDRKLYDRKHEAFNKALDSYRLENREFLEELHSELCPDCSFK